ncbi:MAG: lycopene cyclase family protein, partial [Myxococcota bacterium]
MSLLIVGAGCAGLSLAVHLVEAGIRQPIQLVDPREGYGSDRTWCSFRVRSHPFDECIAHRWSRWQLRYGGVVERQSPRHPYVHIPGEAFYAKALEILEGAPNVSLHLGVEGRALTRVGDKVHLETSAGMLEGTWAFDSRPVPHASSRGLVQHFRGFFVRTEEAVFTPDVAMLMDFDVPQDRGLRFAYVLPLREDMALIEDTFFTPSSFAIGEELLPRVLGDTAYNVMREEGGSIPMTVEAPPAPPEGVVRIG